jgi:hypothetical protein
MDNPEARGGEIGYRPPALPGSISVNEVTILRVLDGCRQITPELLAR